MIAVIQHNDLTVFTVLYMYLHIDLPNGYSVFVFLSMSPFATMFSTVFNEFTFSFIETFHSLVVLCSFSVACGKELYDSWGKCYARL